MIIEKLYRELLRHYEQLYADCATLRDKHGNAVNREEYCAFCPQVGKNFPEAEREGILFVGRATNGWKSRMEFPAERVMAEQLKTINIDENMAKGGFKQYVSKVSSAFYPDNWFEHIAWTNLYKVAPASEGNPGDYLRNTERETCKTILKKEIELLSPKYVIFITGWKDWFEDFSESVNMPTNEGQITTENWVTKKATGELLVVKKWVANDITYILTERPDSRGKYGVYSNANVYKLVAITDKLMHG